MDNTDNIDKSSYAHGVAGFLFAFAFLLIGFNMSDNIGERVTKNLRPLDIPFLDTPFSDTNEISSPSASSLPEGDVSPTVSASIAPLPSVAIITEEVQKLAPIVSGPQQTYLKKGETLSDLLLGQRGVSRQEALDWVGAIGEKIDARKLTTHTRIDLLAAEDKSRGVFESLIINLTESDFVKAYRNDAGEIVAELLSVPAIKQHYVKSGIINSSFYQAAKAVGLPDHYLHTMILHYSFEIDFQREIQKHDSFEIIYEAYLNRDGDIVKNGKILSMSLTVNRLAGGKERRYFLYEAGEEDFGFYDSAGVSIKRALLKTPIDGARLSSAFGYRTHPILGYTKLHKGLDFAAPTGTPIYAAGDGTVEVARRNGGYGKYIRIRHGGSFKTAYAHLSGYAQSVKVGARVHQGQIIGYVGSTGRSTGPHLHYEIIRNGKAINPSKLQLPGGKKLAGKELLEFQNQQNDILQLAEDLRLRDNTTDDTLEVSSAEVQ